MISIKYWPILARSSGLFRMCAESGEVEWEHVTDASKFGAALLDSNTDPDAKNLAPPILSDSDTGLTLSQAAACHQYLGNKLGFNKGIKHPEVAIQYMNDLSDLHSDMAEAAIKGKAANDVKALKEYLTGERYKRHLGAIDRCIVGPYYFGNEPTYVDFAVCSYLDMCEGKWLTPVEGKSGDTIAKYAPKLRAIAQKIRALTSASDPRIANTNLVPPPFVIPPERVKTWDD